MVTWSRKSPGVAKLDPEMENYLREVKGCNDTTIRLFKLIEKKMEMMGN